MEFIDTLITHGSHRALIDGLRIALVMKTSVVGKPKTELAALCVRIIAQMYNNDCGSTAAKASVAQRRQLLRLAVDGQTLWSTNQCQAQQHLCAALKSHHILSDTVQLRTVLGALDGKLLDAQMQVGSVLLAM